MAAQGRTETLGNRTEFGQKSFADRARIDPATCRLGEMYWLHRGNDAGRSKGRLVRLLVTRQLGQCGGGRPIHRAAVKVCGPAAFDVDTDAIRVLVATLTYGQQYPNHVATPNETCNIRTPSRFAVLDHKESVALVSHELVQQHL